MRFDDVLVVNGYLRQAEPLGLLVLVFDAQPMPFVLLGLSAAETLDPLLM